MIEIRHLQPDDLQLLLSVSEGLFDEPIDPVQARAFLADQGHELVLAFEDGVAVSMASGTVLLHPDKPPSMFINEVGTRDGWLRRGIAKQVVTRLIEVARARGCEGIWLGTETDNLPALQLYRALDGEEMKAVLFGWDDAFED